jgi:hypothetical protein
MLVAEHVGELADQVTSGREFFALGGDLGERGAVAVGELARRGEEQLATFLAAGAGGGAGMAVSRAELGGEPAQGAQAAPVTAFAQFGVQPAGAVYSLVPTLAQVGLVRAEQAGPGQAGAVEQLADGRGGGVAADGLAL